MQVYLSENLKSLAKSRGITAVALATKTRSNRSTIHNYFTGALPQSVITLKKIADYFNVELDDLVFKNIDKPNNISDDNSFEGRYEIVIKKVENYDS